MQNILVSDVDPDLARATQQVAEHFEPEDGAKARRVQSALLRQLRAMANEQQEAKDEGTVAGEETASVSDLLQGFKVRLHLVVRVGAGGVPGVAEGVLGDPALEVFFAQHQVVAVFGAIQLLLVFFFVAYQKLLMPKIVFSILTINTRSS